MTTETYTIANDSRVRLYPESSNNSTGSNATALPSIDESITKDNERNDTITNAAVTTDLTGYDEEQIRLMEEVCIVVDENDTPMGSGSKKRCKCYNCITLSK